MSIVQHLQQWDHASEDEQGRIVQRMIGMLAVEIAFHRFEIYTQGDQRHRIAVFQRRELEFALLPGYTDSLGIDAAAVLGLLQSQIIQGLTAQEAEARLSQWSDYLARVLTPVHNVSLAPFLVQRAPTSLENLQPRPEGGYAALPGRTHDEVLASTSSEGFDLLTSDEWEYASSGGARTLFRWGNELPNVPWNATRRDERYHPYTGWQEDQRMNAFGLVIAQNPWNLEYCRESGVVRGGDGGTADSSDAEPYMAQWLPLASAYRYPFKARMVNRLRKPYQRWVLHIRGDELD